MMSPRLLEGKIALVTGASRGIGLAITYCFALHGAKLILTARDGGGKLDALAEDLRKRGSEILTHEGDVTDSASVQALYKKIHKEFGRLDVLVSNAGVLADGLIGMIKEDEARRLLDVNVLGTLNHIQSAARLMRRTKNGTIILTSSIIGRVGNKGQTVYAASKAATLGIMMSAAKELGPDGIRVNAVAPGFIETDMTAHLSSQVRTERLKGIALSRTGQPDDVADVVLFLASDLSRYVSGQIVGVDGCMVL